MARARVALAILADHLGGDARASRLYQPFEWRVVAGLHRDAWTLTSNRVQQVIDEIEAEQQPGPGGDDPLGATLRGELRKLREPNDVTDRASE